MIEWEVWNNCNIIYFGFVVVVEFIVDVFLCSFEATRIRLVFNLMYVLFIFSVMVKMVSEEGIISGFYFGFGLILVK